MKASKGFIRSLVRSYLNIFIWRGIFIYHRLPFISNVLQLGHLTFKFSVRSDYTICEIYFRRLKELLRIICYTRGVGSVSDEIDCSKVKEGSKTGCQVLQRIRTSRTSLSLSRLRSPPWSATCKRRSRKICGVIQSPRVGESGPLMSKGRRQMSQLKQRKHILPSSTFLLCSGPQWIG